VKTKHPSFAFQSDSFRAHKKEQKAVRKMKEVSDFIDTVGKK